jgi:hypothetical protein
MRTIRERLLMVTGIIILITGGITFVAAKRKAAYPPKPLANGFTVQFEVKQADGTVLSTSTRYVKSSGDFFEVTNYPDRQGKTIGTSQGAFAIDDKAQKLHYLGHTAVGSQMSQNEDKTRPGFIRDDSILGQRVSVTTDCPDGPQPDKRCGEFWVARDLGGEMLKVTMAENGQVFLVKEATKIIFGEPQFSVPNYPVESTKYEELKKRHIADR